jgi:hypothetical protein
MLNKFFHQEDNSELYNLYRNNLVLLYKEFVFSHMWNTPPPNKIDKEVERGLSVDRRGTRVEGRENKCG